jgi:hypothetical protein
VAVLKILVRLVEGVVIPRGARKWGSPGLSPLAKGQRALFIGYGFSVGQFAHKIVAQHIVNLGGEVSHLLPNEICPSYSRKWMKEKDGAGRHFDTASELSDFLVENSRGEYFFQRGLIDEYVRRAPRLFFVGQNWLPDSFLEMAHRVLDEAEKVMSHYSALVLVDTAYLQKGCLVSAAKSQGKPVWVLDPAGGWRSIADADGDRLERNVFLEAEQLLSHRPEILTEAQSYARDRFSGNIGSDIDVHFVYGAAASNTQDEPRKVLFLHAIRDAAGLPLKQTDRGELFATFLEWATQALEYVAEEPESWWIKPHPQQFLFPDENKIVQELMEAYSIPQEILRPDLDTRWVLTHRLPIYTHSGTIAVEAATHGYKAHVCSAMYSDRVSHISSSLEDMAKNYRLPLVEAAIAIEESQDIDVAQVMLLDRFSLDASELAPDFGSHSRSSVDAFEREERRQTLDVMWRYRKKAPHLRAEKIAREILSKSSNI